MKKWLLFNIALLTCVLYVFSFETIHSQDFPKNKSHETSLEKPLVNNPNWAQQPEYLVTIADFSQGSSKENSNSNWVVLKLSERLFTTKCVQYLIFSGTLSIPFSKTDIIFPFHYHW